MKLNEILEKILTEARLDDRSDIAIVKWIIKNRGKEDLPLYLSAIQEDELRTVPHQGTGKQILVNQLEHSGFIIILANSYANAKGWFKEAIELFEAMKARGCNESTMLNDYGAALLNQMMIAERKVDKNRLDLARKLIFEAFEFDQKVSKDSYIYPAYKNLCYLRDIEDKHFWNMSEIIILQITTS